MDKRALAAGGLAVVLAVALGAAAGRTAGVAAGVLAALAGLVAPAVWTLAADRWGQDAARKRRLAEAARRFGMPMPLAGRDEGLAGEDAAGGGFARFLRPEEEVVGFRPRPELAELRSWCAGWEQVKVRLVVGAGGSGKTRLARELARNVEAAGWRAWWVPRGAELACAAAVREAGVPAVLVADYAETRAELAAMLTDFMQDGPKVRVVLLARSDGEWWDRLAGDAEEDLSVVLAASPVIRLGPLPAADGPEGVFQAAMAAFAGKLGVERPQVRLGLADPDAMVLVVHAAALLAVLGEQVAGSRKEMLAGLLRHEGRYWQRSATARGLGLDTAVLRRAVMAACLVGADSETEAVSLLGGVPDLAGTAERQGQVARWLHDLYPGEKGEWLGSLRPDLVAEELVTRELAAQPDLLPGLLTRLGETRAARALTVLTRAVLTHPEPAGLLRAAVAALPGTLAVPALAVAVETNPAAAEVLGEVLAAGPLERGATRIPNPSFAPAEAAVVVFSRLAAEPADPGQRAGWLVELSNYLDSLGRRDEALAAIGQAVTAYRDLAAIRPGPFLPALAAALADQAAYLADLGRPQEALAAIDQTVIIYRDLAAAWPGVFASQLASSLDFQASALAALGSTATAQAALGEAEAIRNRAQSGEHG
jgi:hypothetical protein